MKHDILLAGVGGQGILSMAAILGQAAMAQGLDIKQSEVHGMAQRGGAVQSHVRISDRPIASDVIPHGGADLILSLEPMEALRYLPWLAVEGWIISSLSPVRNIPQYPEQEALIGRIVEHPHHLLLDTEALAKDAGSARAGNTVLLGAASAKLDLSVAALLEAVEQQFIAKGERVADINRKAFMLGRQAAGCGPGDVAGSC